MEQQRELTIASAALCERKEASQISARIPYGSLPDCSTDRDRMDIFQPAIKKGLRA